MTKSVAVLGIPAAAQPAWLALVAALDRLADRGRRPVCESSPDAWLSEQFTERRDAAEACSWCPLLDACGVYADAAGEVWGVWAGADRQARPKRPKETNDARR